MIKIFKRIIRFWTGYCACSCEKCWNAPVGKEEEHCLQEDTDCHFQWID